MKGAGGLLIIVLSLSLVSCPFFLTGTLTVMNLSSEDGYAYGVQEKDTVVKSTQSRSFTYIQGGTVGARAGRNDVSIPSAGPFETIVLD